jgi:hypothetical protein
MSAIGSNIRYASVIVENSNGIVGQAPNQIRYLANSHVFQTWGQGVSSNLPLNTINSNIYHNTVMTITSNFVGIGTTNPQSLLHINAIGTLLATPQIAIIEEQYNATNAATATIGSFQTRALNTIIKDLIGISNSSGTVTVPAGTYKIIGIQYFYTCHDALTRLYNSTNSTQIGSGNVIYTNSTYSASGCTDIEVYTTFTSTTNIQLQYWCTVAGRLAGTANPGQGYPTGFIYIGSRLELIKYA